MSHKMKVNVHHDGQPYAKDSIIKKGDKGFEQLVEAGHAVPIKAEGEPEEKSGEQSKSAGKSAK